MKNLNDKDYDIIERYHNNELSEEELQGVLKRIETDEAFEKQVYILGRFDRALQHQANDKAKAKTTKKWNKLLNPKTAKRQIGWYLRAVAAVLLLTLATWAVYKYTASPTMNAQQYAMEQVENVVKNTSIPETRGEASDSITQIAYEAFERKEYEQSIALLKGIPANMDNYLDVQLLLAKVYLAQKDWKNADATLQQLSQSDEYKDTALWLQTLVFIQQKEIEKAKGNLNMIIEKNYPKAKDAKVLLDKL